MDDLVGTNLDLVLSYLSPVDFMHTIETCKYLYGRHRDKIQEKRKESLVRFIENDDPYNVLLEHKPMFRGTRLPNGSLEGKWEILTTSHYSIYNYVNGKQIAGRLAYNYHRYISMHIPDRDKKSFRDSLVSKFMNWDEMDTSNMKLETSERYQCYR